MRLHPLALLLAALAVPAAAFDDLRAPGAAVEKLAEGFAFTEGPTADAAGNVFFTDQPNDRILEWSVDGKLTTFLQPAGRSNGMYFDRDGSLIACADEKNELWSIGKDGKARVIWKEFGKKKLNGPNDVWIHPSGSLDFTDPFYKRPWWAHDAPPQGGQHVYRLSADHKKITRVTEDLEQPNGSDAERERQGQQARIENGLVSVLPDAEHGGHQLSNGAGQAVGEGDP